jgi:hypothetical protein
MSWVNIKNLLDKTNEDLERINHERRTWLKLSSIVFITIIFGIYAWDWIYAIRSKSFWWVIISSTLILCINWWYWTMRVITRLIQFQQLELQIVAEVVRDVKYIRTSLQTTPNEQKD